MTGKRLGESRRRLAGSAISVLIVDDETRFRQNTAKRLELRGFHVEQAADVPDAVRMLGDLDVDVVVADLRMPGGTGIDLMEQVSKRLPPLRWIILTGHASIRTALIGGRLGVLEYLEKPCDLDVLEKAIRRAAQSQIPAGDQTAFGRAGCASEEFGLIGKSEGMNEIRRFIERAGKSDFPVLLLGESGTGKELIARMIHARSQRADRPFVPLNCAGVSDELLGNELFGHASGAYTGAVSTQGGLFEAAEGGVLLLDEIGDMSPANQSSVLRVIETGGYRRLGESEERFADVRIMAATHQNLEELITTRAFRSDLFHRLNVLTLRIAPLRDRKADIPLLVRHMLDRFRATGIQHTFSPEAMESLANHDWPGNVRELENCIRRAMAFAETEEIDAQSVAYLIRTRWDEPEESVAQPQNLADVERALLKEALERADWNKTAAAERLGISRNQLYTRIARYGLKEPGEP